jgi:hypothetical protein
MELSENITTPSTHNVTFPVENNTDGQGYLSPNGGDSKKGLVLISEWYIIIISLLLFYLYKVFI